MDVDWTAAVAMDDALVADLLLRLKHSTQTPTATTPTGRGTKAGGLIRFRWGRRKARSRPDVARFAMNKEYKERATRSPTTPLSWSGGCGTASVSGSGNVDGFEASSMMIRRSTGSRSKITDAYELAKSKIAKRKKTYNDLKKEECMLLDERLNLNRNLAKMHATLTDHRMANQNLKRIKTMHMHLIKITTAGPMQTIPSNVQGTLSAFNALGSKNEIPHPSPPFLSANFPEAKDKKSIFLQDLNMLPSIE